MDKLWAPWRSKYINQKKKTGCIFCGIKYGAKRENCIIGKTKYSFSMLNIYPYNNGHLMVAPYRHVNDLAKLSDTELLDLMLLVRDTKVLLDKKMKPHGYNIGINVGKIAGAGFDGHLHIHIVPRWQGDTNFMPVTANTKVLSESLESLARLLKE